MEAKPQTESDPLDSNVNDITGMLSDCQLNDQIDEEIQLQHPEEMDPRRGFVKKFIKIWKWLLPSSNKPDESNEPNEHAYNEEPLPDEDHFDYAHRVFYNEYVRTQSKRAGALFAVVNILASVARFATNDYMDHGDGNDRDHKRVRRCFE